jgi:hypothetical protein
VFIVGFEHPDQPSDPFRALRVPVSVRVGDGGRERERLIIDDEKQRAGFSTLGLEEGKEPGEGREGVGEIVEHGWVEGQTRVEGFAVQGGLWGGTNLLV